MTMANSHSLPRKWDGRIGLESATSPAPPWSCIVRSARPPSPGRASLCPRGTAAAEGACKVHNHKAMGMDNATNPGSWRELYPFESHFADIEGHRIHYVDEGRGTPVVMVHGNPTWSFYYRNLVRDLSATHRAIAVDHMGCGLSDKPQDYPYRLRRHIDNLECLMDHVLGGEKLSLIVHDWGGAIGMGYAVRHPERIERIVVLNTAAFLVDRCPLRIRLCRAPILGPLLLRGLNGFAQAAIKMAVAKGRRLAPLVRAGLLAPYDSYANRIAQLRFVQDIPLSPKHPTWDTMVEIEKGLPQLARKPMLIGWGTQDFCFNDRFLKEWQARFPEASVHAFEDAGHYVLEDAYDRIGPLVTQFLKPDAIVS